VGTSAVQDGLKGSLCLSYCSDRSTLGVSRLFGLLVPLFLYEIYH
jgi:hypothetical protein